MVKKQSLLGFAIVSVIILGVVYPIYYATTNNLWRFSILTLNDNRNVFAHSPDTYTRVVDELNMTFSEKFENVTQFSIIANGDTVGLSIKWDSLGNEVWKLLVKAPNDAYTYSLQQNFKNNFTLYELSLNGNNVTFCLILNKNYTRIKEITVATSYAGYLNITYDSVEKLLSVDTIGTSFSAGVISLQLKNTIVRIIDISADVSDVKMDFRDVIINEELKVIANVGDIYITGYNLQIAQDTQIITNTGSITLVAYNLSYSSDTSSASCVISSNVGSIAVTIYLSNATEARIEATTNIGDISCDEHINLKIVEKKKTVLVLETQEYSETNGIEFKISSNIGSISLRVNK
ncbi:MAG: hypothetical protein ACP6IS_11850 [Candidatus Asgardarchaeia archaeon]